MSARGVHISRPARLSLLHSCLAVEAEGADRVTLPLEDINYIVLDTDQVQLSAALLAACADQGCLVITCDKKHTPNGTLLPFHTFYKQQETVQAQLGLTQPQKKRLWQLIVRAKIRNQASCLALLRRGAEAVRRVALLEQKVAGGDPENVEAQAARLYFGAYAENFTRDTGGENRLNALLNYGYALVRSAVARNLTALGFLPCLGLHHRSMTNAFNLADDCIEPWRPFVDAFAMRVFNKRPEQKELVKEDRQDLTAIFQFPVLFGQGEYELLPALRAQAEQLRSRVLGGSVLDFPDFAPAAKSLCLPTE